MNILLVEPFFTGSHAQWAKDLKKNSTHHIDILSLPGRNWKWRMCGGAVTLAEMFNSGDYKPDIIVASDMVDLPVFLSLTAAKGLGAPVAVYFHENQLTYPWSPQDRDKTENRDYHYVFKNYTTALAADMVLFNSEYHRSSFLTELPRFLKKFPDYNGLHTVKAIEAKSRVLYLGLDLNRFLLYKGYKCDKSTDEHGLDEKKAPLISWNHRWEYDKNPDDFFNALFDLKDSHHFRLAILGESFAMKPPIFDKARKELKDRIVQLGYAETFEDYCHLLWETDILPVTNNQDFFGISIMEAAFCGAIPLLPERLTYPELFNKDKNSKYFYNNQQSLVEKLGHMIDNLEDYGTDNFQKIAEKYDWSNMIEEYDNLFEQLLSGDI